MRAHWVQWICWLESWSGPKQTGQARFSRWAGLKGAGFRRYLGIFKSFAGCSGYEGRQIIKKCRAKSRNWVRRSRLSGLFFLAGFLQRLNRRRKKSILGPFFCAPTLAGAKAQLILLALSARLKSCPFTKPVIFSRWEGFPRPVKPILSIGTVAARLKSCPFPRRSVFGLKKALLRHLSHGLSEKQALYSVSYWMASGGLGIRVGRASRRGGRLASSFSMLRLMPALANSMATRMPLKMAISLEEPWPMMQTPRTPRSGAPPYSL